MGDDNEIFPLWQKIYQVVSGSNENVIESVIEDSLEICKEKGVNVLLDFKVYSTESFEEWKKVSETMLISQGDEMCSFIRRMSRELDLDVNMAWAVICNFLIFDYFGKVDELKSIIRYEANIKSLIDQLWMFYTSNRMFLLKTIRFILEKLTDKSFVYHEKFVKLFEELDLELLWKALLESFDNLLQEINSDKASRVSEEALVKWIRRNNREQIEILLLMINVIHLTELRGDELEDILKLFIRHGFGRHPLFYGAGSLAREKDVIEIQNAEAGVVLALLHQYWDKPEIFKMISKQLENDLEQYQMQGNNSSILFFWVVFKNILPDVDEDYCKNVLEILVENNIFETIADFLTLNIYQNCKVGEIIVEAVHRILRHFRLIASCDRDVYQQKGIIKILSVLFKRPDLNVLNNDNLGVFFEIGLDMFPYQLDNFLCMVESLLTSEEYYDKVLTLLHNCPTYCTELSWPYNSDAVMSPEERNLFLGSDKFIIPANTLTEKCDCFGYSVVKFHYKYDFFNVIEQFLRSLTMWAYNRGDCNKFILDYVLRANKFLCFLIRHYRGNFKNDTVIKPLLQRLDCVPTYYNKWGFRSFDFFSVYFEAKCALVKYQNVDFNDAFPPFIRKMLFPEVDDFTNALYDLRLILTGNNCILYEFLKEEENLKDHKLLIQYIEIILDVLKKDILHQEVLYSGIWYILNIVFPSHKQWNYDDADSFQQVEILNGCLQICMNVLQKGPRDLRTERQVQVYKLVRNSLLDEPVILNNFYNVFVKDKYYLANLMHQESNWIAGRTLIVLDTVKLELTILLLIFLKCRGEIPKNRQCKIDDFTHVFAKSASGYFITPYNCTLAVLAGKFLETLARDENIPLMSCLGIDYDQIQTLFLERLRDPMEDENVKLNILEIIGTCIIHQTGMTAAFFNIQSSKKWYNPDVKRLEGDTVGDFMLDYLKNIKKSVSYLKSPLQVGILKVMKNLWRSEMQHLIKDITASEDFWTLLIDPLFKPFEQTPFVYYSLLTILSIHFSMSMKKPEGQDDFFNALESFLCNQKQLRLFQQYLFKIFSNEKLEKQDLKEREMLICAWNEILIATQNQNRIASFPNSECQYFYIKLAFEGVTIKLVHENIFSTWLDYILVIVDLFGLEFEQRFDELSMFITSFAKISKSYYKNLSLKDKRVALTICLKAIDDLSSYYEECPAALIQFLDEIGPIVDIEYSNLQEQVWDKLRLNDPSAQEAVGPWALVLAIINEILDLENCKEFAEWFKNRNYLDIMVDNTCDLLSYKDAISIGKISLYGLTLYMGSGIASDIMSINMMKFYDRIETIIKVLLASENTKFTQVHAIDLKSVWVIMTHMLKFNQHFLIKFRHNALPTCYAFITLYETVLKHIMDLPENNVDFDALEVLGQTIEFYHIIIKHYQIEWYRKSNKTFNFAMNGIRKVINSCIYLCLRPKHIRFCYLDEYTRLVPLDQEEYSFNKLMVCVIDRLLGILNIALSCLYKLNVGILELFEDFNRDESTMVWIENDFSVPRFELPIPYELTYGKLLCLAHFLCKALNQLHQTNTRNKEPKSEKYLPYVGLVQHQNPSDYMPDQKLSSFLRYLSEYSGLIDPWINNLNYTIVQGLADTLMLFIAQQAFLTIGSMEPSQATYYRRNLYSELQFFYEYVKKRTSELPVGSRITIPKGFSGEMDYIKRFLLYYWQKTDKKRDKRGHKVTQENFLLILSFWFSNICQIQ